jgi:hypothetical protein
MPVINADNADAWRSLAKFVEKERPSVGKTVTVDKGKHRGKTGVVERHMLDRYYDAYRYGSSAQHHMTDMRGRDGYVVLIRTETETFWVKGNNVTVLTAG